MLYGWTHRFCAAALTLLAATTFGCEGPEPDSRPPAVRTSVYRASVTVFPMLLRLGPIRVLSHDDTRRLAEGWSREMLGAARVVPEPVPVDAVWSADSLKLWRADQDAFAAYVREHPVSTDFALFVEYLFRVDADGRGRVYGVLWHLTDAAGTLVEGRAVCTPDGEFCAADPRTPRDCVALVERQLRGLVDRASSAPSACTSGHATP